MFKYQDLRCKTFDKNETDSVIYINSNKINVKIQVCKIISKKLQEIYTHEKILNNELDFDVKDIDGSFDYKSIENLFTGNEITINKNNWSEFHKISQYFEMDSLSQFLSDLIYDESVINDYFVNDYYFQQFIKLEELILGMNNFEQIMDKSEICFQIMKDINMDVFFQSFIRICETSLSFINIQQIIKFIEHLQEKSPDFIERLIAYCESEIKTRVNNSFLLHIIHELYEKKYISLETIQTLFHENYPFLLIDIVGINYFDLEKYNLSKNERLALYDENYALHKKGIIDGHCQDPILISIREDNLESFQDQYIYQDFASKQIKIKQSEYEITDILNDDQCSLIDYSAFFGSVKCFNFLILNQQNFDIQKCICYAIAGGNKEIISKLNSSTIYFQNENRIACKFHQHNLFEWLFENNTYEDNEDFLCLCFENWNIKTLFFIIQQGFSLITVFHSAIKGNNIFFAQHF